LKSRLDLGFYTHFTRLSFYFFFLSFPFHFSANGDDVAHSSLRNFYLVAESVLEMAAWMYTIEHISTLVTESANDQYLRLIDLLSQIFQPTAKFDLE
jgi:hypothetical protein